MKLPIAGLMKKCRRFANEGMKWENEIYVGDFASLVCASEHLHFAQ